MQADFVEMDRESTQSRRLRIMNAHLHAQPCGMFQLHSSEHIFYERLILSLTESNLMRGRIAILDQTCPYSCNQNAVGLTRKAPRLQTF